KIRMSAAEWTARFKAMAAAGAFKDEQMRILSNAQIEEGIAVEGTQSSPEQLTPAQFAERVKELFEARPALLDEETTAELMRVFTPPRKEQKNQTQRELEQ